MSAKKVRTHKMAMNAKRMRALARKGLTIEMDKAALCILRTPDGCATGFAFMKPSWVVTARHVVLTPHGEIRPIRAIFDGDGMSARLLFAHPVIDLAVLELGQLHKCVPFLQETGFVKRTMP